MMIRRVLLKRGLIALWCLAAASCAKVTDEVGKRAASAADAPAAPEPAVAATAPSLEVDAPALDLASSAAVAPITADAGQDSVDAGAAAELQSPPSAVSTADLPAAALEPAAVVAPDVPAGRGAEPKSDLIASSVVSPSAADTLDVTSLLTRLRKTKAINLRTKLAVKNESDDLLERFRAYHEQHDTATLAELRRSYDSLFRKLTTLLEDADPPLARDIDRSRGAIWAILVDPTKFGA